jgi:hypothetical protein
MEGLLNLIRAAVARIFLKIKYSKTKKRKIKEEMKTRAKLPVEMLPELKR